MHGKKVGRMEEFFSLFHLLMRINQALCGCLIPPNLSNLLWVLLARLSSGWAKTTSRLLESQELSVNCLSQK